MIEWLALGDEDRLVTLQQANALSGISMKALEKDWWVTLVLKAVFNSPYASHLQFKGGTSLSKCYNLINRFSEDIDLSIDRAFLGYGEDLRKPQVKKLKKEATRFTSNELRDSVEQELIKLGVPAGELTIIADPIRQDLQDIDPQTIRIYYRSLLPPVPYIEDHVKMEVSARSLKEDGVPSIINSIVALHLPDIPGSGEGFSVTAVHPKRTFLEKVFLLHEEFLRPTEEIVFNRMSRHLYDLVRMMDTEHPGTLLKDHEYYQNLVEHRRRFIFKKGVDYATHHPSTLSFLPPEELLDAYERDYTQMTEQMIYGDDIPTFSMLLSRLEELKNEFRKMVEEKG